MTRIPNRFEFGLETPPEPLSVSARLKWLKNGNAVVFCGRQWMSGHWCAGELGRLCQPGVDGVALRLSAKAVPVPRDRWYITPPRGVDLFVRAADGAFEIPKEPKLGRRPVPPGMLRVERALVNDGFDGQGRSQRGRALVGVLLLPGAPIHCPDCGTVNIVDDPGGGR
jgi:hypothetical protein